MAAVIRSLNPQAAGTAPTSPTHFGRAKLSYYGLWVETRPGVPPPLSCVWWPLRGPAKAEEQGRRLPGFFRGLLARSAAAACFPLQLPVFPCHSREMRLSGGVLIRTWREMRPRPNGLTPSFHSPGKANFVEGSPIDRCNQNRKNIPSDSYAEWPLLTLQGLLCKIWNILERLIKSICEAIVKNKKQKKW